MAARPRNGRAAPQRRFAIVIVGGLMAALLLSIFLAPDKEHFEAL